MLYGATLPYRFNERKDSQGRLTYSAITSVHYFGEWAFVTGLSERLQPSWVHAFLKELKSHDIKRLHYYRKGEMVIHDL